ncbi:MAG: tetratricopeptide repeat protein [Hyphomonadaceae bacterium]
MPDTAAPDPIKAGTDQSFMADVIEASKTQPVLVDFWAPWCGPCKQLTPLLEKQVRAAGGKVKLVKINIDENPGVAGQLGVRSIPAVFAFDQQRPVDGFMGLVPESQIKLLIDRLTGGGAAAAEEDIAELLAQSAESLKLGDAAGAAQGYVAVLQLDPANTKALAGLARVYLAAGDAERAQEVLAMTPPEKANDPEIAGVRAALELASAADGADAEPLMQRVKANPADHEARLELARALAGRGDLEGAADHLLASIAKDRAWNEEAARKQLLQIIEAAGAGSDLAKSARRRLSAILFS